MFGRFYFLALLGLLWASNSGAQGLPIAQLQCQASYRGVPFTGVVEIQLFRFSGISTMGNEGIRRQMKVLLANGRASEFPGTLVLMGEFQGGGAIVHIEAMNVVGGQGTGGIIVNGQAHRATYATFYLVQGGIVAQTEYGERINYLCK